MALLYDASSCGSIPVIRNLEEYYDNDLLLEVKGIGEATLEKLRQEVTVGEETDNTQEDTVP